MRPRLSVIVILFIVLVPVLSHAEIPQVITYQGKVTDAGGTPVADGSYSMRFRIYDAATAGTMLWDSGVHSIVVSGGIFSVPLGESPQPALGLPFDADYWLQVTFAGVDQTPRQRLASTGYAYMASGLVPGTEVNGSVTTGASAAIKGTNTATTGARYGVYGEAVSTSGRGVCGQATATTGYTYGVWGGAASIAGIGVFGNASSTTGTTSGVMGGAYSTDGIGVYGWSTASTGATTGVYGESTSPSGRGVYGRALATTGSTMGVRGESASAIGIGVYGENASTMGTTYGVMGASYSSAGIGIYGSCYATVGSTFGVRGYSGSTTGYGVYSSGNFAASGSKSCVVKTSQGPTQLYCQESPENWFEDVGRGQLVDGRAHVELDPLFLETVTIDAANPMNVFVQLRGDCHGVFVAEGLTGFDVIELQGGTSHVGFVYRVMAKRKGFEEKRLDYCQAAETDSYLCPELREQELARAGGRH